MQESRFSPWASRKEHSSAQTSILAQWDFWPKEWLGNNIVFFEDTKSVVICGSYSRKWIYLLRLKDRLLMLELLKSGPYYLHMRTRAFLWENYRPSRNKVLSSKNKGVLSKPEGGGERALRDSEAPLRGKAHPQTGCLLSAEANRPVSCCYWEDSMKNPEEGLGMIYKD